MEILGRDINIKYFLWYYCFNGLIIIDMFLITIAIIFQIPSDVALNIQIFDGIVCLILLGEYALNLYMSTPKKDFILDPLNILGLIASIPFDLILTMLPGINILNLEDSTKEEEENSNKISNKGNLYITEKKYKKISDKLKITSRTYFKHRNLIKKVKTNCINIFEKLISNYLSIEQSIFFFFLIIKKRDVF